MVESKKMGETASKTEKKKASRKVSRATKPQKKAPQLKKSRGKKQVVSENDFNSTLPLPTPAELLETAYLLVLENRKELILLTHLDTRKFFELLDKLPGIDPNLNNTRLVHDGRRILQERHPEESPPPLWTAWMESVYAERLAELIQEIST